MLFKSYLKSSKKHISFSVNKICKSHTTYNRFKVESDHISFWRSVRTSASCLKHYGNVHAQWISPIIGLFFNGLIVYLQLR